MLCVMKKVWNCFGIHFYWFLLLLHYVLGLEIYFELFNVFTIYSIENKQQINWI